MKKNWFIVISVIFIAVFVASCKKEPLPNLPEENDPYYSVKGYIDGEFIDLNVGQEGILISQGVSLNNGIKTYFGQIVSPSEDLLMKIEFTVPERPVTAQGLDPFTSQQIQFLVHETGCKSLGFGSNIQQSNFVYVQNDQGNFEQLSELSFKEYGKHDVTFKFTNVSPNHYVIPVNYGYNHQQMNPDFTVYGSADTTFFAAFDQDGEHSWYIDDNLVSNEAIYSDFLSIGIHKVEHQKVDEYGNIATKTTLVRITDFVFDWKMDINNCQGSNNNNYNYGKVIVTVNTNGHEYKSYRAVENLDNSFIVNNVEFVGSSPNNPDWAVFDFEFESVLINQNSSDSLSLTGMSGTFNIGLQ